MLACLMMITTSVVSHMTDEQIKLITGLAAKAQARVRKAQIDKQNAEIAATNNYSAELNAAGEILTSAQNICKHDGLKLVTERAFNGQVYQQPPVCVYCHKRLT